MFRQYRISLLWNLLKSHRHFTEVSPISSYSTSLPNEHPDVEGPLSNIRILDLTRVLAGPFATMILADMGASVIKVERPGAGDDTRSWGPPFLGTESCYFVSVNRNKSSLAVNMKTASGVQIIKELAKKCDVMIENFIPGSLDRLGLGYKDVSVIAPRLIYCSLTGYGSSGPYSERPGYDVMAASVGGLMGVTGPTGGPPCKIGVAMTDLATGLYAHGAIIAALMERTKTDKGQKIDCDLLSTQVSCMTNLASSYLNGGIVPKPSGTEHASIVPYQAFETKDGYISIAGNNNDQFRALCERIDLSELYSDGRFKANSDRVENRDILIPILSERFKMFSTNHWLDKFNDASFPYAPINSLEQTFSDPQVKYKNMVETINHPTAGEIKLVKPAVTFEKSINCIRNPSPILGQHSRIILRDLLGYSDKEIKTFKDNNVIECA